MPGWRRGAVPWGFVPAPPISTSAHSTVIALRCCCSGQGSRSFRRMPRRDCEFPDRWPTLGERRRFLQSVVASSADEFVEAARLAFSRLVLMEECKLTRIEGVEKLFPADPLQPDIVIAAGLVEINSKNASAALFPMPLDLGRVPAPRFRPAANFIVIGG